MAEVRRTHPDRALMKLVGGDVQRLVQLVATEYGLTPGHLLNQRRMRARVSWARLVLYWVLHHRFHWFTWTELGQLVDRDRTTVRHGVRRVEAVVGERSTANSHRHFQKAWAATWEDPEQCRRVLEKALA